MNNPSESEIDAQKPITDENDVNKDVKTVRVDRSPFPLYPTRELILHFDQREFPTVFETLGQVSEKGDQLWHQGFEFLNFIAKHKSPNTYIRFRTETERFILWILLIEKNDSIKINKLGILKYIDFCFKPEKQWLGSAHADRFIPDNGIYQINADWRPFVSNAPQNSFTPSQAFLLALFTGLSSFFQYALMNEWVEFNPIPLAKKDCRYLITDAQVKSMNRLC